jgi:hypothetical protein
MILLDKYMEKPKPKIKHPGIEWSTRKWGGGTVYE